MRNITLSADENLIDRARRRAESENTTLNNAFRSWLEQYSAPRGLTEDQIRVAMSMASGFRLGRMPSREERNER